MQLNEHAYTPEIRSASCVVVSFTLDLISWFSAEHAVCEPCHLTWSIHLSGEANESYERWFRVSVLSWSIGRPESMLASDTDRPAEFCMCNLLTLPRVTVTPSQTKFSFFGFSWKLISLVAWPDAGYLGTVWRSKFRTRKLCDFFRRSLVLWLTLCDLVFNNRYIWLHFSTTIFSKNPIFFG